MSNDLNLPLDASRTGRLRDSRGVVIGDIFFPGKAAHIVKCVNAHDGLVEALRHAKQFIKNGIELGYIRMPDTDCPDSAHNTLPAIEAALAKAQGDQDGTR